MNPQGHGSETVMEQGMDAGTQAVAHDVCDIAGQAVLLNWLGQQQVVFHRIYVDITGGVVPALCLSHLLSQLMVALQQEPDLVQGGEYPFKLDTELCKQETGLSSQEQRRSLATLLDLGLLRSDRGRRSGLHHLVLPRLAELMLARSAPLHSALRAASGASYPSLDLLELRSRARQDKRRRKAA